MNIKTVRWLVFWGFILWCLFTIWASTIPATVAGALFIWIPVKNGYKCPICGVTFVTGDPHIQYILEYHAQEHMNEKKVVEIDRPIANSDAFNEIGG